MRKNVKKQLALRVLSTAALMAMVSSIATAAFADTYDLNKGSVDILAEDGKQYITQWEDESKGTYVTDDKGEIKDREDADITLTTKDETTGETKTTSNTVTIDAKEDNTANVTLKDVHIETEGSWNNTGSAPIEIKGDGDTNLELNGDNTVLSGDRHHAAIEKADKNGTGTLTIKDDLNDNGSVKDKDENGNAAGGDTGKLLAGGYGDGAGIGGGCNGTVDLSYADTSNITIKGGEITARGGYEDGAGIGGGTYGNAKNIRIEGNAHVTASGDGGAGIGGGIEGRGNDVTITGNAVVNAYSEFGSAIGDGRPWGGGDTTITISGNATVHAEGKNGTTAIGSSQNGHHGNLTITIAENANVTAIGSINAPAIGNAYSSGDGNTTIRITGGTVNAINSYDDNKNLRKDYPAIGAKDGKLNLTIDGSTGDTVVNAYQNDDAVPDGIGEPTTADPEPGKTVYKIPTSADYNEDGSSNLGENNSVIINYYKNASVIKEELQLPDTLDKYAKFDPDWNHHCTITGGTLTKVVHNRKYMEENPNIDTSKLKDEDLHDWKLVGKVVEPTTEKEGYADYICSIDKCGQTKHVVLPKIVPDTPSTPETPDTPSTPDKPDTPNTPNTPDTPDTPSTPVTPDVPVQDAVPDTAPADAAVTPAAAQNVVQDTKPEAAAPAAVSAAALPQTGANWLAVVGSALSGLFLLAAGFVLDRKGRRMN
jgi:LPXTG-motif cell wall-anchored protein